ncbi:MAG: ABC transporter substrate-binding protein [Bacteroidales bacterium]
MIRIPRPQAPEHPESVLDPFGGDLAQDTATLAESDTLVPYEYEELVDLPYDAGRVYRVAYLIPFDYKAAVPLDSLLKDAKSEARRQRIAERYRLEQAEPQSVAFLEFFQGSLLALDSLSRAGMKVDVRFYDTRKSMARTRDILNKPGMERMDLIIGPFYPFNLELVSQFARENRIPVVTPFYGETNLIRENPYLFQPTPTVETEYRALARLVASHFEDNIVFVQDGDSLIHAQQDLLKELIFDGFERFRPSEPVTFKEIELDVINTDEIIHSLRPGKKNLVVVPTRNEALASPLVQSLYFQLRNFDIEVVGNSAWTEFASIDYRRYHELKLIFYSGFWKDYQDPDVVDFLRKYRKEFYSEPQINTRAGINYGIAGYDMSFYFLSALRSKGPRFLLDLDRISPSQVLSPYHFDRVSPQGALKTPRCIFTNSNPT